MDVVERWARHLRATGRRPNTIASYRSDVHRFRLALGERELLEAGPVDVAEFVDPSADDGLRSSTHVRRFRSLHQFYGWLAGRGEIADDPTASVERPALRADDGGLTDRDLAALLGACSIERLPGRNEALGRFESRRDGAIVLLLLTTGLTARTVSSLHVGDVDVGARTVRVDDRHGSRDVSILGHVADAIGKYLDDRSARPGAHDTSKLWLGERGALTQSGLSQLLARRASRAGIRRVSAADFRRRFAADAIRRGADLEMVAALGGWGSGAQVRGGRSLSEAASTARLMNSRTTQSEHRPQSHN